MSACHQNHELHQTPLQSLRELKVRRQHGYRSSCRKLCPMKEGNQEVMRKELTQGALQR